MAYREITESRPDGSTVTYREYERSKVVAALLALFLGGLGIHWFYTRHYLEGFAMWVISYVCLFMINQDSLTSYLPMMISVVMALYFLFIPKDEFDRYVNKR